MTPDSRIYLLKNLVERIERCKRLLPLEFGHVARISWRELKEIVASPFTESHFSIRISWRELKDCGSYGAGNSQEGLENLVERIERKCEICGSSEPDFLVESRGENLKTRERITFS